MGSSEETRGGAETVRSLKDGLGRPCNYNGSCASQQVPMRLLHLAEGLRDGPVECAGLLHLDGGHGITVCLSDVMGELSVSTRVLSKWPMDTSLEDLSYLHEMPVMLLHLASGPHGPVECARLLHHLERSHGITASFLDTMGGLTKELHNMAGDCTLGDGRPLVLQIAQLSTRVHIKWLMETSVEDLLCYLVHFGDLNMTKMRGEDVNEIYTIESTAPICFLIHTPGTQEQRTVWLLLNNWMSSHWLLKDELDEFNTSYVWTVWLLLKNSAREAFKHIFFHLNSACMTLWDCSSFEKNQAIMKKENGGWLVKDQCDRSYKPCFHNEKDNKFKLSNIDDKHDGVSIDNNGLLIPIFVRHISGELVLTVNLNQSSQYLMNLYAEKTNTKLECQYFVYGTKKLEPDSTLLFYGVERDTTVHVCTRLLGGMVTIGQYLHSNKNKLLTEVTLPDKRVSLMMTKEGCLFLSTWIKCFTSAFADSKSWNGDFSLEDFRVTNHHVLVIKKAEWRLDKNSMHADLTKLIGYIKNAFSSKKSHLISKYAPYLENLTSFLEKLESPFLHDVDRLFIETHICCMESHARGTLLVKLRRKNKTLDDNLQRLLETEMTRVDNNKVKFFDASSLSNTMVFKDIIAYATRKDEDYSDSKASSFRLMRDEYVHAPSIRFDKSQEPWKEKFKNDDGIELMIPAENPDLVPDIIHSLIRSKLIDIEPELRAAQVWCTCCICHPSHPGSKGEGESSTTEKGKQPASPTQVAASPVFPRPATDRSFLDILKGAPTRQPSQTASSPGFSQPAAPRWRPPSAPTRQSSSGFGGQTPNRDRGKGKR